MDVGKGGCECVSSAGIISAVAKGELFFHVGCGEGLKLKVRNLEWRKEESCQALEDSPGSDRPLGPLSLWGCVCREVAL